MKKILITGGKGQLGNSLKKISKEFTLDLECQFMDSDELDITNTENVNEVFEKFKPDYCINAAAYTAVDLAEKEAEKAFAINADGVKNLAVACNTHHTVFIHISTDYVFDGETNIPYSEDNFTNPIGIYGQSKLKGEELALEQNPNSIIIRTSWLYSEFNKNFVKTMLMLFKQKDEIGVVSDQFGQPTYAGDLAEVIFSIINSTDKKFGVYHFSNYPETTWYDFAKKIAEIVNSKILINKLTTDQYSTPAKRPKRSTMNLDKIEEDYHVNLNHWENSLEKCLHIIIQSEG